MSEQNREGVVGGGDRTSITHEHEETSETANKVRYGVRIGDLGVLVPDGVFSEITVNKPIYSLPNTQTWLPGVVNDHGDVIPVYDLYDLFGVSAAGGSDKNILLMVDQREHAVALKLRDYPLAVRGFSAGAPRPEVPEVLDTFVGESFSVGGDVWVDFDHRAFFLSLRTVVAQ